LERCECGISYLADGTIDPANAAIAGWVNVISMGNGWQVPLAGMRQVAHWVTGLMTKIHCLVRSSMVLVLVSAMALVKGSHGD
jgi:hypothetical protein